MSIYEDMQKYCILNKASIHQIMAVKIFPIKYDIAKIIDILNNKINIIFQSKNAIDHSLDIHQKIKNNNKIKLYCLGKYSAKKIKEIFFFEAFYPSKNYSSEKLLDLIIKDSPIKSKFLIIKGEDGRTYLQEKIKERGHEVLVIDVYKLIKHKNKNILVIPSMRLTEGISMENIHDMLVINNNEEASEYIRVIKEHNNG